MNKIYLCEREINIRNVYGDDEVVYTKEQVLSSPETFKNTKFI